MDLCNTAHNTIERRVVPHGGLVQVWICSLKVFRGHHNHNCWKDPMTCYTKMWSHYLTFLLKGFCATYKLRSYISASLESCNYVLWENPATFQKEPLTFCVINSDCAISSLDFRNNVMFLECIELWHVMSTWCRMVGKVVLSIIWFFPSGERAAGLSIETTEGC